MLCGVMCSVLNRTDEAWIVHDHEAIDQSPSSELSKTTMGILPCEQLLSPSEGGATGG